MITRVFTRLIASWSTLCLVSAALASAEEVQWREDYNKARQEATETGRPLVIDLSTENCFWCKQLDLRTFSDSGVATLLNERFIPLKVDAQRTPRLVEALRVQSFPTLVYATPDGRILGFQEGFLEAPALKEHLEKALAAVATPDWMTRDYQDAVQAHERGDHARALALLKNVVEDGKDRPVQVKARQLLQELEQQAAVRCSRARELADKGDSAGAIREATELVKTYPGTRAAQEGRQLLLSLTSKTEAGGKDRARRAQDLLAQAHEDYRLQQFLCCLDRCEELMAHFADLPEGVEASQLAVEIKANPEWTKQACDQLGERLSVLYLALADTWLKKGQPQQAVFYLERVVQNFPSTRHAEAAQARLAQIQGSPPRSADVRH